MELKYQEELNVFGEKCALLVMLMAHNNILILLRHQRVFKNYPKTSFATCEFKH